MRIVIHTPIVRTVPPEEIVRLLRNKLAEEVHEYEAANAAQLFAQLQREAEAQGIPWNEVKRVRAERAAERGVYNDGVYLERTIWTRDPQDQRPTT